MIDKHFTHDELKHWRKQGYELCPIIQFGGRDYILLFDLTPHEGRNDLDVVDIAEHEADGSFPIIRYRDNGGHGRPFALVAIDEGMSMLTAYKGNAEKPYEYVIHFQQVLAVNIVPPTREQMRQLSNEMDDDLEANGPASWLTGSPNYE